MQPSVVTSPTCPGSWVELDRGAAESSNGSNGPVASRVSAVSGQAGRTDDAAGGVAGR